MADLLVATQCTTFIRLSSILLTDLFCLFALSYRRFSTSVQENLSRGEGDTSDLIAINIRRGHDRGLPSYTRFRRFCGLPLVRNFSDLVTVANFGKKVVAALEKVYKTVEDVDMFTGGKSGATITFFP